jgi:hypothetical protein
MTNSLAELMLTEEDYTPKYQIYCDLDGVLTDFERRFVEQLRKEGPKYYSKEVISQVTRPKHFEQLEGSKEFWTFIDQHIGLEFWSGMPWMPNGKQLWNFIAPYGPKILSSPSREDTSRLGKRLWVKDNLVSAPPVIFRYSNAKAQFADSNSILIDDKPSNLAAWKAKGGIAIECKDGEVQSIIKQLEDLGYGKR